jgi:hypothetical protein
VPEFYERGSCTYQKAAQPYLDAIARGVRDDPLARAFLLQGTEFEESYRDCVALWDAQRQQRDPMDRMSGPFWSNYWTEPCEGCTCRIDKSVSMEIDAMFYLQNSSLQIMAVHLEMKRDRERLSLGQAQAYRPRAACYRDQRRARPKVLAHDHFLTVLVCGEGTDLGAVSPYFDRVITHPVARAMFGGYPATNGPTAPTR